MCLYVRPHAVQVVMWQGCVQKFFILGWEENFFLFLHTVLFLFSVVEHSCVPGSLHQEKILVQIKLYLNYLTQLHFLHLYTSLCGLFFFGAMNS